MAACSDCRAAAEGPGAAAGGAVLALRHAEIANATAMPAMARRAEGGTERFMSLRRRGIVPTSSVGCREHSDPRADFHGWRAGITRWTKASAVFATARQPLSIVSAWPRSGISTNSVALALPRCFRYVAWEIACGTV